MKKVLSVLVIALFLSVSAMARTQSNNIAPAGSDTGKAEEKGANGKEANPPAKASK